MRQVLKFLDNKFYDDVFLEGRVLEIPENIDDLQFPVLDIEEYLKEHGFTYDKNKKFYQEYNALDDDQLQKLISLLYDIIVSQNNISSYGIEKYIRRKYIIDQREEAYEISKLKIIGRGSFCNVYEVNEFVVKKQLNENYIKEDKAHERLKEEYDIMTELAGNLGILKCYEYDEEGSFTMERAKQNLFEFLSKTKEVGDSSLNESILKQILETMKMIHSKEIIHRDLHMGNIFIMDDNATVKISDFGLAKNFNSPTLNTYTGPFATHEFIAPEVLVDFKQATEKSDIYSIGKIISKLFKDKYNGIVEKCLQRDPELRYKGIDEIIEDISVYGDVKEKETLFEKFKGNKEETLNILKKCDKTDIEKFVTDMVQSADKHYIDFIIDNYQGVVKNWEDYDVFGYVMYLYLIKETKGENRPKVYEALIENPGNRFYIMDLIDKLPIEVDKKYKNIV